MQTGSTRLWQRVLAVLCAAAMLLMTFPQAAFTAFAEELPAAAAAPAAEETPETAATPETGTTPEPSSTPETAQPVEVTVTGITFEDKTYDGTTKIDTGTAKYTLDPVVEKATVTGLTFEAESSDAGVQEVTVTDSGTLKLEVEGVEGNYTVKLADGLAPTIKINSKPLTVKRITFKPRLYNGKTDVSEQIDLTDDRVEGDKIDYEKITCNMKDANAGAYKEVDVDWQNVELTGDDAKNYSGPIFDLDPTIRLTINIEKVPLRVTQNSNYIIEKYSDGTTDVPGEFAEKEYYTVSNAVDGETPYVVAVCEETAEGQTKVKGMEYSSSLPGNDIAINITEGFEFKVYLPGEDGTDVETGNYQAEWNKPASLKGNIIANRPFQSELDLGRSTDGKLILSAKEDGGEEKAAYFAAAAHKDSEGTLWFKDGEVIKLDDTKNTGISLTNADGATPYNVSMKNNSEAGKPQLLEDVYINADNVVYGSLTITYNYDNQAPTVKLESAEAVNGTSAGKLDMDHTEITYTFTVEENGCSGVRTDAVQYLITDNTDEPKTDADGWEAPAVTVTGDSTMTFKVTTVQSGYIWVKASDNAGNEAVSGYRAMVIEKTAPTVTATVDNDTYEKSHHVTINAKDTEAVENEADAAKPHPYSGIKSITYTVKDKDGVKVLSETQEKNPPETFEGVYKLRRLDWEVDISKDTNGNALDGDYTLTVKASDFCGNTVEIKKDIPLHFDNTAPKVTLSMEGGNEFKDGNFFYRAETGTVSVTFEDARLGDEGGSYSVTVTKEDQATSSKSLKKSLEATSEQTKGTISFAPSELFGDGKYSVSVTAKDHAGNETEAFTCDKDQNSGNFTLDTTPPVLEKVSSTGNNYVETNEKKYWNTAFTVTYTVTEENFSYIADNSAYVEAGAVLKEGDAGSATVTSSTKSKDITVTVEPRDQAVIENNVYSTYLMLKDAAGNQMVLNEEVQHNAPDDLVYTPANGDLRAKAETKTAFVLDTKAPVATLDMSGGYLNGYDGDDADYYNEDITATFTVEEANYSSSKDTNFYVAAKMGSKMGDKDIPAQISNNKVFTETVSARPANEGHYTFTLEGKDLAGNELTFAAGQNVSAKDRDNIKTAKGQLTTTDKVLDVTNPVVSVAFETGAKCRGKQSNNRFYYNSQFTATLSVNDTNFTSQNIDAKYGYSDPEDYESGDVEANNAIEGEESTYTQINKQDGLYVFSIYGCDKAGNPLEANTDAETTDKKASYDKEVADLNNTSKATITTFVAAVDTEAPTVAVNVGGYYAANLNGESYTVSANAPYRKETKAELTMNGSDRSPMELEYTLVSSINNGKEKKYTGTYTHNATESHTFDGQQVFAIKALKATDLAGNVSTAPASVDGNVSNYIYLDVAAPVEDKLAPTVSLTAHGNGMGRSSAGVDLYDGTVTVEAKISDPGFKDEPHDAGGTSSGLHQLRYEVTQSGNGNWTGMMTGKVGSQNGGKPMEGVVEYTEEYASTGSNPVNQTLKGEDTVTFTFDAATFNYNDITLKISVVDNAGNESGGATYTFGIDTTAPTIEVSYDNNDAQNEKYFKADRTATITVTERNFNPDATEILTESMASIGGWSYTAGGSANGDDDIWTCQVSYTQDGDYTFDVHARDLLGHDAGEADYGGSVAPKEFVIDKTKPVIEITFDNNDVRNGKYYNEGRTATIHIEEHNFSADGADVTTTASIAEGSVSAPGVGGWSTGGDSNTAQVPFIDDGDYTMHVEYVDMAGNEAEPQDVNEFTVDTTPPELEIGGVEDRMAYNGDVAPSITYHDINYDNTSAGVSITGYKHPEGSNLTGARTDDAFGGSFVCDNIEVVKENDDVYTATGSVSDLAGNTTEETIVFSVNRFGSTYILSKETQALVDGYYTNTPQALYVTEINVSPLEKQEITTSLNGEVTTLQPETDYAVRSSNPGWMQYDYTIQASNFGQEGAYTVTLYSEDAADNTNTNRAVKENEGKTNELPIDFLVDMTAPVILITGVEEGERYVDTQRTLVVHYDDNTALAGLTLYLNGQKAAEYNGEDLAEMGGELEYTAKASNEWQILRVVSVDVAGNQAETDSGRFLLTDNLWVQYINNKPLLFGSIGLLILLFILLLLLKRKKDKEEEQKKQKV